MASSLELRAQRANLANRMTELVDRAESESRNLNTEERTEFDRLHQEQNDLLERITRQELVESTRADLDLSRWIDGQPAARGKRPLPELSDQQRERWARWQGVATGRWVEPDQLDVQAVVDYSRAFSHYMRTPKGTPLAPEHASVLSRFQNVLQTTTGAAGGFLIPPEMSAGLERALLAFGGMRQAGTPFRTDTGADFPFAVTDDTGNTGEIVAEGSSITTQDTTFGVRVMKAYMYSSKLIPASLQLLNDSAFDLESHISTIAGERIGRIQNTHFTTGTGANQPSGIVGDATLGVTAAAIAAVTWSELIDLEHSVGSAYRSGASYMFNDTTLRELKQMVDGVGHPLWQPGFNTGDPDRINGYPYVINDDMATMATTAKSILFGQLSRYRIRDVMGLTLFRLDELYALSLQVGFFVIARSDGALIDAGQNPVKYLQQA